MHNSRTRFFYLSDVLIMTLSVMGLGASLILSLIGVMSIPNSLHGTIAIFGKINLIGAAILGFVFVARYQQLTRNVPQGEVRSQRYQGCPKWMRITCYVCMLAGAFLFFLPAIAEAIGWSQRSDGTNLPATLPGGFGLLAYSAYFSQLYSGIRLYGKTI